MIIILQSLFSIFEFITCNSDFGPVASYTAPGFNSCSFFSNLSIDPTDRFLLSGSSNGQAYIWDTLDLAEITDGINNKAGSCVFELPVYAQLEVSKTAWVNCKRGSLEAQIACISDDLTFSLFNWNLPENEENSSKNLNFIKRPRELSAEGREKIYQDHLVETDGTLPITPNYELVTTQAPSVSGQMFSFPIAPNTPIRNKPTTSLNLIGTPPNSANKSILDFFTRSPRI